MKNKYDTYNIIGLVILTVFVSALIFIGGYFMGDYEPQQSQPSEVTDNSIVVLVDGIRTESGAYARGVSYPKTFDVALLFLSIGIAIGIALHGFALVKVTK